MAAPVGRAGLWFSVGATVLLAATVGGALVALLPGGEGSLDATLPRTGPVGALIADIVAFVWIGLFAALGAAFWLVRGRQRGIGRADGGILALLALCSLYPLLASGLERPDYAIAGNMVVIAAALCVAVLCLPVSRLAAALVLPVAGWVALATAGLVAMATGARF